jgi:hypothetical protein
MSRDCLPNTGFLLPILLVVALAAPAYTQQAERRAKTTELFATCANKALVGDFGKLHPWQEQGYRNGLAKHKVRHVWQTVYFPSEGFPRGQGCRWGIGVSERVVAANRLPAKSFIWIANPAMLRQVWDTGAKRNDRVAEHRGAALWVDIWIPYLGYKGLKNDCYLRDAVLIPAAVK